MVIKIAASTNVKPPQQPPESTDTLRSATATLLAISVVFCATPPLPLRSATSSRQSRRRLRCRRLAQFVWPLLFFTVILVCMVFQHRHFDAGKQQLERFLYTVSYAMSATNNALIAAGTLRLRSFYRRYGAEMRRIDGRLLAIEGAGSNVQVASEYVLLRRFVRGWLLVLAAVMTASLAIDVGFNGANAVASLRSSCVYLVPNVSIGLVVLQFVVAGRAVGGKYAAINRLLERRFLRGKRDGGEGEGKCCR